MRAVTKIDRLACVDVSRCAHERPARSPVPHAPHGAMYEDGEEQGKGTPTKGDQPLFLNGKLREHISVVTPR